MAVPTPDQVLATAADVVDAFAHTDTEAYFASFTPEATFCFHTEPTVLTDRAAYERLWAGWVAAGWRVVECTSSSPSVVAFEGGAAFTHHVHTVVEVNGERDEYDERETIVFADTAGDGTLMGVHEHLSTATGQGQA